jgi:hypothetical protein
MEWVVKDTFRPFYPQDIPRTFCTGGWVGKMAGLDGCGRSCPHRDSIPGPSSSKRVAIPTELSRPTVVDMYNSVSYGSYKFERTEFHCFTVHFNSLCVMVQQMHLYVTKHQFKCHTLKHLKSLQHVSIISLSSSGSFFDPS